MNRSQTEPSGPDLTPYELQRRHLLKWMAASAALASGACSGPPQEKIVPYVRSPEEQLPGKPLFYATSLALSGYAMGVLVETNEGRPIKVEGNPLHPASLGATDVFAQAAILQLWDPARSQAALRGGQIGTWQQFLQEMQQHLGEVERTHGEGLFLLTGNVSSPTLQWQIAQLRARYPAMNWHQYDPLHRDHEMRGAEIAFGRPVDTVYYLDRVRTLLTLDADLLSCAPSSVRYARDLMQRRNPDQGDMSRLYALESNPGLIGAKADHRVALPPAELERCFFRIAHALGVGPGAGEMGGAALEATIVADLRAHQGECLVVPGSGMPPQVHAMAHLLNHRLGGRGTTFDQIELVAPETMRHVRSITALSRAIKQGRVRLLIIIGGNPAYDAPADLDLVDDLRSVPQSVHLSEYVNETSSVCRWHLPRAHEFERWGDLRAFDGTAGIIQPTIAPLYGGRSEHELLSVLLGTPSITAHDSVRSFWQRSWQAGDADATWRRVLRNGVVENSEAPAIFIAPRQVELAPAAAPSGIMVANFIADQSVRDGQYANNGWLQELPRSMSKLTWDNAAYLSPRTAARLHLATGDEVELRRGERKVRAGVWILPDHADECVTLPLGYGRTHAGPVGNGIGFDAYRLRTGGEQWHGEIYLSRTGSQRLLVTTQNHARMEGRNLIRSASAAEFAKNPRFATDEPGERVPEHSLYPEQAYDGYKWGMVIDLNACIGCNACTIACQAENNIPVVGKEEVNRGREMHWVRIDRYYEKRGGELRTEFQPVPCMHCEHAPCEEVCPVGATVHDSQGLNLQVYNRCVGTRFCSNNCPYKVRRFNFLQYSNTAEESLKALHNPEVTVRQRGVMEKCTYCVQRIQRGRIQAEELGRRIGDGEVVTACQAVCPTQAISFGDLNDPAAAVRVAKASPRNYALLAELNTRPRTTYLAQVVNRRSGEDEE